MKTHITDNIDRRHDEPTRRRYERPRVIRLGDLRGSTFGVTIGAGESGAGGAVFDFMFTPYEDYDQLP